ncbi:MAG: NAD(+) synthase [Spirochaetes bacterium]|nr:NAD(+) synthase [Spirochaetota bacterium]
MKFSIDILKIDPEIEARRVADFVADQTKNIFRRSGVVVGLSGGIDSAVMAAIAVRAVGKENVIGLILPERESNPISSSFAAKHAGQLGIDCREVDITPTVDSVGGYSKRDDYIRSLVPDFKPGYKYNISLPTDLLERDSFNFYVLQVQLPDGSIIKKRLGADAFRAITSFANIKIRSRMLHLYYASERHNMIVAGTTNRTEMILGDFCKYGDGGTDIEALSYLYKNQIYQIADYVAVIPEIIKRSPSPDTFSLPVTDQEFFFRIPFEKLDHLLYAWEKSLPEEEVSSVLGIPVDAVRRAFKDFTVKNRATAHIREMPHALS